MSEMFQLLTLMAVPAAFFVTCRYVNLRGDRVPSVPDPAVDTMPSNLKT